MVSTIERFVREAKGALELALAACIIISAVIAAYIGPEKGIDERHWQMIIVNDKSRLEFENALWQTRPRDCDHEGLGAWTPYHEVCEAVSKRGCMSDSLLGVLG